MKNLIKATFALLAMMLLTACSKDDDTQYNKIKTLSGMVVTDDDGIQSNISYKYDTQGRLTEISIDNPYIVIFEFTYRADGRIEKIRRSDGQGFIDFTYSYSGNSIIPDRMKYSGAVPTYTTDVVYTNNSLFFNDEAGKEYAIEGVDVEKNTYSSIMVNGKILTFHFAPQLKNGLEKQSVLNIPLTMTMTYFLTYQLYGGIPLYSQVITGYESSDGEQLKWQYETDVAGYITKIKNRKTEYRYQ